MKKPVRIGCLLFLVLGLALILGQFLWKWKEGPTQAFTFLNTAAVSRSVTFEKIGKEGTLEKIYTIDNKLAHNQFSYNQVPPGNYQVTIWNDDKSELKTFDFQVILNDAEKTNHQPFRLDIALDKVYAVVHLNVLYEGEAFASFMSKAAGTHQTKLQFEKFYDGSKPFYVADEYTTRTFIDIDDKIPSKVKYGELVYGLFAFPKSLSKDQVEAEIIAQIKSKIK
ncbi:MAG: hypothetical protein BGO31_03190 [Bacteroidetes bacterium 43-16]|nr:MAG: hypothetical protein BGO31_03190 [Bacteroidetes bacterium 43-16]